MLSPRSRKTGIRRFAISALCLVVLAGILYFALESFVVSRRRDLIPLEVIGYVVVANLLAFIIIGALWRVFRWVAEGFRDVPERD